MNALIERHFIRMHNQLVDSELESTRVFWRMKYGGASEAQALDPRPFSEVVANPQEA